MRSPRFINPDGKAEDWSFHLCSQKSKKIAFFRPYRGKTEEYPAGKFISEEVKTYSELESLNSDSLIDSDVICAKLVDLKLPINKEGQIWARFGGGGRIPQIHAGLLWYVSYYNSADGWEWRYLFDMVTGEMIEHRRILRPIEVDFETGRF